MRLPCPSVLAAVCMAAASSANATLITFEELPWRPIEAFYDYPVDTQYAPLGVSFNVGYLNQTLYPDPQPAQPNQYLLGGHDFSITFSGTLPTHVSFNLSSPYGENSESYASAFDASNSLVGRGRTGGYYPDGSQDPPWAQDFPYQADRLVSFYSASGIASIGFSDAYGSRLSASIDNLYFGTVAAVPEPATLALWVLGIGVLAAAVLGGAGGSARRRSR